MGKIFAFVISTVLMATAVTGCGRWGEAEVTTEDEEVTAVLENSQIRVNFGRVQLGSGEPEDCITEFVIKSADENQVASQFNEGSVQILASGEVIEDSPARKGVRLVWHGASKIQEAYLGKDEPVLRLDYRTYPKWIVDIGAPGGITKDGEYAIYGAEEWKQEKVLYPEIYYDVRDGDTPGPLSYNGWFIAGVYNPENGRGFGRVMPVDVVDVIKLLWGGGIEFLSFPGSGNQPFTGYLFAVTGGRDEILSLGKRIADEAENTILGEIPLSMEENIPFEHTIVDTAYGGIRRVGDISGDGYPDIVHGYWYDEAPLSWYEYMEDGTWQNHVIRKDYYPQTDNFELGDVDGDGDLDVIIAKTDSARIVWYKNPRPEGDPRTDPWEESLIGVHSDPSENYIKDIKAADFDGDGLTDVVSRAHVTVSVFRQLKDGGWEKVLYRKIHPHEGMDVGDLDRDGDPDIVLNGFWLETPDGGLDGPWREHVIDDKWYTQTGDWTANNCKVYVKDMNGDDRVDVLLSQSERADYPVAWYASENPRRGSWTEHVIDTVDFCHTLKAADMDNDGDIDIVVGEMEKSEDPDQVLIYRNRGDGISWKREVVANISIYSGVLADIGGDGDMDIVANRNWNQKPIEIWKNMLLSQSD